MVVETTTASITALVQDINLEGLQQQGIGGGMSGETSNYVLDPLVAADDVLSAMMDTTHALWKPVYTSSNPLESTTLLADSLESIFDLLDSLVVHAVATSTRLSCILALLAIRTITLPSTWPEGVEEGKWKELEGQWDVMIKWAIGAMSIELGSEEKTRLAIESPEVFGRDGSSSKWA